MIDLKGKVAIVTGASSGIGRASAKLFARAGAKVVVAARRKAELEALVREIADQGGDALALAGDVSDEGFAKELVERAEQSYGRLDVAFNNAGTLGEKGGDHRHFARRLERSAQGQSDERVPRRQASDPRHAEAGQGFDHLHKHVCRLHCRVSRGRSLCGEQIRVDRSDASSGRGIRAVEHPGQRDSPGAVETTMYKAANETAEQQAYLTNLHALKRIASPDELARAALYLASDASSFQSGTAMLVDGGLSITRT
jgi:NAD(P)-dependent dehydrogenase (short-subunit alcohol dehydrogenase family)